MKTLADLKPSETGRISMITGLDSLSQRLAEMDFLQIVDELTPAMRAQLEPIVGVKPTETGPPN